MELSTQIKTSIADQLVRVVAPLGIGSTVLSILAIHSFAPTQVHRYYPALVGLIFVIPAWWLALKGKPIWGANLLVACFIAAIATGMYVSGGVHAPVYKGLLSLTAFVVCLYSLFSSAILVILMMIMGTIFYFLEQRQMLPPVNPPPSLFILMMSNIWLLISFCLYAVPVKMLQKALKAKSLAEKKLQSIIDKTPDLIYRLTPEGTFTFVSDAIRTYGYLPEDLIGQSIFNFIHPDDIAVAKYGLLERRTGKRCTRNLEVRFRVAPPEPGATQQQPFSEDWVTFLIASEGIYDNDRPSANDFSGVQGIAHDISTTRHYEARIRQLAAVVEQASEDVIITDGDGIIKYVNPAFETVTGYGRWEVIGKTFSILKSGRHDDAFYTKLWETIRNGEIWKGHIWNKTKAGVPILQDVTITPILDSEGDLSGYASIRRDITLQSKLQDQLQQAQKMEAIGTLASGIAHDFNNILAGMIGYTDLALEDVKDQPEVRDKLNRVMEGGSRAADLVKQILSFSRSQKKEVVVVSPHQIAVEVMKLMRAILPATIEIKHALNSVNSVIADATNIHQILMNLCTNAGHAMRHSGGTLSVRLEDVVVEKRNSKSYLDLVPGKYVLLHVADTGHGIPREIQAQIFDPFFTTKTMGEGTGMGLAAVQGIVKELGGRISVYSEVGDGTVFDILIPVLTRDRHVQVQSQRESSVQGSEKILFVDDEKIQIELAEEALGRMGYQIKGFTDSVSALEHFQQDTTHYDLIITDMTMPKMTGDILARKIHHLRSDIPIIMCTGFSEKIDEYRSKAINISAFLNKPVIARELLHTIRNILDNHTPRGKTGG